MHNIDTDNHTLNNELPQDHPACRSLIKQPQAHPDSGEMKEGGIINAKGAQPLPLFLRDLLASPPRHGDGVHHWLYKMARQLHAHRSEPDICALLATALANCGRTVSTKEMIDAVTNSKATAWRPGGKGQASTTAFAPRWPKCNEKLREAVLTGMNGFGLADLCESSPHRCDGGPMTNELLAKLFPRNSLLCAGMTNATAITKPLSEWLKQDMSLQQFVVPSPMTAVMGLNQQGKESYRCLANTGKRNFAVIEFDEGTKDEQAAIVEKLATLAPLSLVVSSGGKSLHSWYNVINASKETQELFFRLACELGADPATWTPCQFVRMPDGTRPADPEKNKPATRQTVHFFNPYTLSK